jgi:ribosomal protein S18 acetylase RimI-like enzyme
MDVTIRRARPDEYARVGALTVAAYRTLAVDHLWGGYDIEILDVASRAERAEVLVAVVDSDVAGAVTYVSDDSSPWLEWTRPGEAQFRLLAVDPGVRGRGIGEALAGACIDRARGQGRSLVIHTTRWMPAAQRLYVRLGFVRREDRDVPYDEWYEPGTELPPEWVGEPFLAYLWSTGASSG